MKPFSFREDKRNNTGCCSTHDWPVSKRWQEFSSQSHHKKCEMSRFNKFGKRARRRTDKQRLNNDN